MHNIYLLDIASALFVLVIIIFRACHKAKDRLDSPFKLILYSTLFFDFFHGATELVLALNEDLYVLAYCLKLTSCLAFSLISSGFAWYTYKSISKTNTLSKHHYFFIAYPLIWNTVAIILNEIFHICLDITNATLDYKGLYFIFFFPYIFIMTYMGIMSILYKKSIYPSLYKTGIAVAVTALIYGLIQMISYIAFDDFISFSTVYFSITIVYAFLHLQYDQMDVDETSGLYMRNKAIEDLNHLQTASVFLIEIAKFHQFDSNTGDRILKKMIDFLDDIFNKYTMYRVSSNQIMIITMRSDDIQKLNSIANNFVEPIVIDNESYFVDVKIAFLYKNPQFTSEHTLYLLETMLSEIINTSKSYIVYDSELEQEFKTRENDTKQVMKAMNDGGVIPYYQGIYSIDDEKVICCEALARLNINGQVISPGQFLPILESHRCVSKLDREMLINVLKELNKMKKAGRKININSVSINFTAEDILNPNFIETVKTLIKENEIDPSMICFEISESVVIENFEMVESIMLDLNEFGINFFLDDFGTGFSNLNAVLKLPFYLIKIDKSLLDAARTSDRNQQILNGIVKAINSIGMKTLVEGVETKEDVDLVKRFGAHYIQGYYYYRPGNFDNFCDKNDTK